MFGTNLLRATILFINRNYWGVDRTWRSDVSLYYKENELSLLHNSSSRRRLLIPETKDVDTQVPVYLIFNAEKCFIVCNISCFI